MLDVDWASVLSFGTPLGEILVRGTLTYLALFALLRVTLKREASTLGLTNLLVVVLIADAAQNAMADDYRTIPDGLLLVATILFWSYALDWLGFRFPRTVGRFVHPAPLPLVIDGRLQRRNMRAELITVDELKTQLRLQGVADLSEVRRAYMEGNGEISVVRVQPGAQATAAAAARSVDADDRERNAAAGIAGASPGAGVSPATRASWSGDRGRRASRRR
jgi:uncharacterized membrane protein YcaP (DUF421 family)